MSSTEMHDPQVDAPGAYHHRFAEVNGIRIHYLEEGTGPLVILLHGFPFLWYLWRHQIRPWQPPATGSMAAAPVWSPRVPRIWRAVAAWG